jgi:polysaccharide export outer membrane protein
MPYSSSARGCSSVVRAPACHAGGRGFKSRHPRHPAPRAAVAQLVEQRTENPWVAGSNPAGGTILLRWCLAFFLLLSIAYAQKLAPGDRIRLICEQEPTLSVERVISPDGDVVLPLLGKVNLAGKFVVEAEDELQKLAAQKLGIDGVLIALSLITDAKRPIDFSGAVGRSGSLPYHDGMILAEVVKLAEPNGTAAIEAVEITGADGKRLIVDLEKDGGSTRLRPGDRVFFPKAEGSNEVLILGGVAKPGSKPFKAGLTLRSLIALAGGITGHGRQDKVRLDRKGEESKTIDVVAPGPDVPLLRGDIVTVPLIENGRFVTMTGQVTRLTMQIKPGDNRSTMPTLEVEFWQGMKLSEAIKSAGGISAFADPDSITVKRLGAWKHRFSLSKIASGEQPDLELVPADIIDVPVMRAGHGVKPPKPKPRTGPVVPPR